MPITLKFKSQEEGDSPRFTDAFFNFVPGSAFEISASLAILDQPGNAGLLIDGVAFSIVGIINKVFNTDLGNALVAPNIKKLQEKIALKDYFSKKIISQFKPSGDQIGRCLDIDADDQWDKGLGVTWLCQQLLIGSNSAEYNYKHMLTKVKAINALGGVFRDLTTIFSNKLESNQEIKEIMHTHQVIMEEFIEQSIDAINEKITLIKTFIFHEGFNEPTTRDRVERTPLVFGQALTSIKTVTVQTINASELKLGFGKVFDPSLISGDPAVINEMTRLTKLGRQIMPRLGQDVIDHLRPGLLGESSLQLIPKPFISAGLKHDLVTHPFDHGSSLNRWLLRGTYAKEGWNNNFPMAGSQSGVTVSFFISFSCLSKTPIFGNPDALKIGLIIAAFMNFGGYHSFIETFPIAQAVATKKRFAVQVSSEPQTLYSEINQQVVLNNSPDAVCSVQRFFKAYSETLGHMREQGVRKSNLESEANHLFNAVHPQRIQPIHRLFNTWKIPSFTPEDWIRKNPINLLYSNGEPIKREHLKFTIFDVEKVVFRSIEEMVELSLATKGRTKPGTDLPITAIDLVTFKPERIALHQIIVAVITRVQYIPFTAKEKETFEHDLILQRVVKEIQLGIQHDISAIAASLLARRKDIETAVTELIETNLAKNPGTSHSEILSAIEHCEKLLNSDFSYGQYVKNYSYKQALISLATDMIYKAEATKAMQLVVNDHVNKLIASKKLIALTVPNPTERVLFLIAGGVSSGKGSSCRLLKSYAEQEGIKWSNISKGGGDSFRLLLMTRSAYPELFSQLTGPEASYISHTLVKEQLMDLANQNQAPHIFIEQVYVGADKLALALHNQGSAKVIIVSTDVEKAVNRAFHRGIKMGRYEPVKDLLKGHKGSTEQLPLRIKENAGKPLFIKIVDNNVGKDEPPIPIALINCLLRSIIILDEEKMKNFITKTLINIDATCYKECYDFAQIPTISIENYFKELGEFNISYKCINEVDEVTRQHVAVF